MILLSSIIQQIFSDNIIKYIDTKKPDFQTNKVMKHIVSCRTPELGAAVYDCKCGERLFAFHSCRDRHCPVCQGMNNARWAEKQMESSLPVKYYHIVFTLPDTLNSFIRTYPKQSYNALFKAAASTLLKLCADPKHLCVKPGFTAVLHTWGQTMQFHPHLHVIITAGGLSTDGVRFIDKSDATFLLPVKVVSKLFRGIFIDVLNKSVPIPYELKSSLYKTDFFCYLKEPLDRAGNVVKYLARYANRVCITDYRIISYNTAENSVTFSYTDNKDGGNIKTMTLCALEFMRRFLLHVLPKRFMKIRHFGILNNRDKFDRLKRCSRMLNATIISFIAKISKPFKTICHKCGNSFVLFKHMTALETLVAMRC